MTTATTPSTIPDEWDRRLTSRAERYADGKALRSKAPRSSHAEWAPDPKRLDPISLLGQGGFFYGAIPLPQARGPRLLVASLLTAVGLGFFT